MTKKTIFGLSLLLLFAFTFGFAFTLTSTAQASQPTCCIYDWCPGHEGSWISREGHYVKDGLGQWYCVYDGSSACDYTYLCE